MDEAFFADDKPVPEVRPFQFSMRAMFIGVAIVAILLGILVSLVRRYQMEALRAQCTNNLRQIGLAMHNYHDTYKCFPSPYIPGPDGKPWHSWRMAILPYVESTPYYQRYSFHEPWDGPNNRALHPVQIWFYRCPAEDAGVPVTNTSYLAVVGPGTAWSGNQWTKISDIKDGTSNSILIVEVADSGVHWMEPRDLTLEDLKLQINPGSGRGISSNHVGGACVCFADGSVHFLPNDLAAETLRRLLIINDGGEVSLEDW